MGNEKELQSTSCSARRNTAQLKTHHETRYTNTTHHVNIRFDQTGREEGVMIVDIDPYWNRLVVDCAQVWVN